MTTTPTTPSSQEPTHTVQPPVQNDQTAAAVAAVLVSGVAIADMVTQITAILVPWKISAQAIEAALGLARNGTTTVPNARHAEHGTDLTPVIRSVRMREMFYRAMYLCNAAKRIDDHLKEGESLFQALHDESPYYRAHEGARRGRLDAVSQAQRAADIYGWPDEHGTLVGWYLNPLLKNEHECIAANGHNFYVEDGTLLGYPGSVHPNCGCYSGAPWPGGAENLVDDHLGGAVKIGHEKPKFKLKKGA